MLRACEQAIVLSLWIQEALTASLGFLGGSGVKNPPAMQELQEMQVQSLGRKDPLEEGMAAHSSILTGSPGGGHGSPLQYSYCRISMLRGA